MGTGEEEDMRRGSGTRGKLPTDFGSMNGTPLRASLDYQPLFNPIEAHSSPLLTRTAHATWLKGKKRYIFGVTAALLITAFVLIVKFAPFIHHNHPPAPITDQCLVFCTGPILRVVQSRRLFNDSKEFVDMPLKVDPSEALYQFALQGLDDEGATDTQILTFLDTYFDAAGSDLEPWIPPDFSPDPPVLNDIVNGSLRAWAKDLNQLWSVLGRKEIAGVSSHPSRHSLLHLPYPIIVPGGRFRESYYWDSYWIVLGLLACNETTTAKGIVRNFMELITSPTFGAPGFVPNGGRTYYLSRSQPPLLSEMVSAVYNVTHDTEFLAEGVAALDMEYAHWMKKGAFGNAVEIVTNSKQVTLNRYVTNWTHPRPESWVEDTETARAAGYNPANESDPGLQEMYRRIAAMAESGWDFSSRWLTNSSALYTSLIPDLLPVDLNAIMYRMELNLAAFHTKLRSPEKVIQKYTEAAAARAAAIEELLWNNATSQWHDFDVSKAGQRSDVTVANFLPLWAGVVNKSDSARWSRVSDALNSSGLVHVAGLATTLLTTGQQWDFPNAWAPLQHLVIVALSESPNDSDRAFAMSLTKRWLLTNLLAYQRTSYMFEKYNATALGFGGSGGEYSPQAGFGWTNGVVFDLLQRFGPELPSLEL